MRQIAVKEIGMLKDLYSRLSPYIGLINLVLLTATAYYTTVRHFLRISFVEFVAIVCASVFILAVVEYTVVLPSHYMFINEQAYKHGNLIKRDLDNLRQKELKEILHRLNVVEEMLHELCKDNSQNRGKTL